MKKFLFKISSFLMALLVMSSTMSFTIESHYCGDILVDTSLFGSVESCGMDAPQSNSFTEKNCCSNERIVINGQNELNVSFDNLTIDQQIFVASLVYSYINLFEGLNNNVFSYEEYRSPLVIKQLYMLDETYLI